MEATPDTTIDCRHHWLLSQPLDGEVLGVCRKCGTQRVYPAVLDDLDPGIEEPSRHIPSVAAAAGGARPSSGALPAPKQT